MNPMNRILAGLSLGLLAACGGGGGGGGSTPPPPPPKTIADTLTYTNPSSGDYRLVKSTTVASTATHLVLDLVGPASGNGRGVAFTLGADGAKVTWTKVAATDADLVQNGVFDLGTSPQIYKVKVGTDNTLQAGLFQKGSAVSAKSLNATLARVALDLKAGVVPVNSTVSFSAIAGKANVLPESGAPQTITVSVGTLLAQ